MKSSVLVFGILLISGALTAGIFLLPEQELEKPSSFREEVNFSQNFQESPPQQFPSPPVTPFQEWRGAPPADVAAEVASPDELEENKEPPVSFSPTPSVLPSADVLVESGMQIPAEVRAVYLTSLSAAAPAKIQYVIDLAKSARINAVVIDIKDYSGRIAYDTAVPEAATYLAERVIIGDITKLIEQLHNEGLYVIGRITVFQDPVAAAARPDLAVHSKALFSAFFSDSLEWVPSITTLWRDHKALAWLDPAAQEIWEYHAALAKDAAARGFDEINFDYIRFPSDGNLQDMKFLFWDGKVPKPEVIRSFFQFLRKELEGITISADLFGLTTVNSDDLGIGQILEYAYRSFDYVSPMVYPSHYADGFLGYENPAEYPYEVVKYSLDSALRRLNVLKTKEEVGSALRPWLQDFDLGADYNEERVRQQIQAVKDALGADYHGFMLWNPSNVYTLGALENL